MKQFIIDLITVKSHSNHLGANRVILSILLGKKKGAIKMLKSSKDEDGFVRERIRSTYLFTYLLTLLPGLLSLMFKESPVETLWNFPGPIRTLKTSLNTSSSQRVVRLLLRPKSPPSLLYSPAKRAIPL